MKPKKETRKEPVADSRGEIDLTASKSRKYRVRIRTANGEFEGLLTSPYPDRRLSEALTRMDEFLNVKDVKDTGTGETFAFVVVTKSSIETIKVIEEWQ